VCNKNFGNRKSSYINHIEKRITPCKPNININSAEIQRNAPNLPNIGDKTCKYCNKEFTRIDSLNRHILNRCKVKKEQENSKEEIFKKLLEQYEELKKEHTEFKNKITILENQVTTNNSSKKIYNTKNTQNNMQNNINVNISLVAHGEEDLKKISWNVFKDAINKSGVQIFEKLTEGIHFNDKYPEYKNIYISDYNRDKCMKFDGKKWILESFDPIYNDLIDKLLEFGYINEEKSKEMYENKQLKENSFNLIKERMRWLRLLDNYADDLEYSENEETIDMKQFRKKHDKENAEKKVKEKVKKILYNNKEKIDTNEIIFKTPDF
jgi:hypothetical protein